MQIEKEVLRAINILKGVVDSIKKQGQNPSFPESSKKLMRDGVCLFCKQKLDSAELRRSTRGVHHNCFRKANRDILEGIVTESDMIEKGLLAPKGKSGRKRVRPEEVKKIERNVKRSDIADIAQDIANNAAKLENRSTTSKKGSKK